jgi:hypothetical protein
MSEQEAIEKMGNEQTIDDAIAETLFDFYNGGTISRCVKKIREAFRSTGYRLPTELPIVSWMEQERKRHGGQDLGESFKKVLLHYYQHKNILIDK